MTNRIYRMNCSSAICLVLIGILVASLLIRGGSILHQSTDLQQFDQIHNLAEYEVETHKGLVTLEELNENFYFNDKNSKKRQRPKYWDRISELMMWPHEKVATLAYSNGKSMFNAMKATNLTGMSGFVVGSMKPWTEVSALINGASKLLTVEYNEFSDRMSSILPIDFARNWEKYAGSFDFAASFSSIEHSGLGRYGDPIDPIGDFREMLKIKCMLKPGGILFLGFPVGIDAIAYNAHRIYGSIRLAFMFYGFEWVGTYSEDSEELFNLSSETLYTTGSHQRTFVLRKL